MHALRSDPSAAWRAMASLPFVVSCLHAVVRTFGGLSPFVLIHVLMFVRMCIATLVIVVQLAIPLFFLLPSVVHAFWLSK